VADGPDVHFLALHDALPILGLGACSNNNVEEEEESKEETFNPKPNPDAAQVSPYNDERMEKQAEMDADLLVEYEEDDYTVMNPLDRKSTRLNSSHVSSSYAV